MKVRALATPTAGPAPIHWPRFLCEPLLGSFPGTAGYLQKMEAVLLPEDMEVEGCVFGFVGLLATWMWWLP